MESDPQRDFPEAEPSVLDWVKSLFRGKPIPIPEHSETALPPIAKREPSVPPARPSETVSFRERAARLRLPISLLLALIAQRQLEARSEPLGLSLALYLLAALLIVWAYLAGDFRFDVASGERETASELTFRPWYFLAAVALSFLTVLTSSGNRFRFSTIVFWSAAAITALISLWDGPVSISSKLKAAWRWLRNPRIAIKLDRWALAFIAVFVLAIFYRFYRLDTVPFEMWSDQAEKLLDVVDVLNGKYSIFFPRNTGREAFQFYLAAITARLLGTGISFLTLKIGTALAGLVALPFLYLFGKEIYGRKTGLIAMALAAVAYWPNAISRVGLRFPLYPLFAAPALYFLVRGLKRKSINAFLICGLFVGLGLHGYSPARILPIVIAVGVLVYLLHRNAKGSRLQLIVYLFGAGLVALVVFLPLMRVAFEMKELFLYRALSRMSTAERELPGPPLSIFIQNLWNAAKMFGWDNGEIWVISIPHRPALDWVTAALFHLGFVMAIVRYIRRRDWQDLFVLVSIPVLMMPSILSLAFPAENPAPNRASGAIVPVFTLAAVPLVLLFDWVRAQWPESLRARRAALVVAALFLLVVSMLNYDLVFNQFADQHLRGTWNTGTAGRIIKGFADSIGSFENAHVVPYPYWMDTRLVGIHAGVPTRDFALWPDQFGELKETNEPRLFLLKPEDEKALRLLNEIFPDGEARLHRSPLEGKDILVFFVPPNSVMKPVPTPPAE